MRDAVENLAGARCLDRAFGNGNDLVRAALKETAADSALLTRSKRSGSLMTKTARRRILARVAQGDTHTTNGVDSNALTLAKRGKKLLHSRLLSCQLLFVRTIGCPPQAFMIEQGDLGSTALRADETGSLCERLE